MAFNTYTIAAVNTGVTTVVTDGILNGVLDGLMFPLTGGATEAINLTGARYCAAVYAAAGVMTGSLITRKRIAASPASKPFLGFLF